MAVNITKTEKFTNPTSSISFSQIRSEFGGNSTNVRAAIYRRNTSDQVDWDAENASSIVPKIPDATENIDVSADNNWKIGSLRNVVTNYVVTQSGTNEELSYSSGDISTWNGNLSRNVLKRFNVNGTIYANEVSKDALAFSGDLYNLDIEVSGTGEILGEGGGPGGSGFIISESTQIYTRTPVFRYLNPSTGDHFSTTSQGTQPPSGYISEGELCRLFSQPAPGTVGIFDDDDGDRSSSGRPYSGIMGYGYLTKPSNNANVIPIYALTNGFDTMWSTSTSEGGYTLLRTEFWAPTADLVSSSTSVSSSGGSGGNGGDALYVNNTYTKSDVVVRSYGKIYSGGGGGSPGSSGNSGPSLSCSSTSYFNTSNNVTNRLDADMNAVRYLNEAAPGRSCRAARFGATWVSANQNSVRDRCRGGGTRRGSGDYPGGNYQCSPFWTVLCQQTNYFSLGGGNGGNGGAGGRGRGFSYQSGSLAGAGNSGSTNSCSGGVSRGNSGNPGNSGGDWGQTIVGGGTAGAAIKRRNTRVEYFTQNTLKGPIQDV